jgi:hypothetical protein
MLRVGPENGRRLKLKLADVRQYIARGSAARPPGGGPPPANR